MIFWSLDIRRVHIEIFGFWLLRFAMINEDACRVWHDWGLHSWETQCSFKRKIWESQEKASIFSPFNLVALEKHSFFYCFIFSVSSHHHCLIYTGNWSHVLIIISITSCFALVYRTSCYSWISCSILYVAVKNHVDVLLTVYSTTDILLTHQPSPCVVDLYPSGWNCSRTRWGSQWIQRRLYWATATSH